MGLFDKVKAKMGVKDWLQGFECPRCGGRVYKTSYEKYSCESCGELTGDAYYRALRYDLMQQDWDDYKIDTYINMRKRDEEKEKNDKIVSENYQKRLEEEARMKGDTRRISKYDWLNYTKRIILGRYTTDDYTIHRDRNGHALLAIYPRDTDSKNDYHFIVYNRLGDDIGEGDVYLVIYITAKEFLIDDKKTTKDSLYIILKDIKANVHQSGLHYLAEDHPENFNTSYGLGIYETLNYFADEALKRFRQEVIDAVYNGLASVKRTDYGFDDVTFSNIYFEQ